MSRRNVLAALPLLLPCAVVFWCVLWHIWEVYGPARSSFGLHLKFGGARVYDPWSDLLALFAAFLALFAGIAIARDSKKKNWAALFATAALAFLAIGFISAA